MTGAGRFRVRIDRLVVDGAPDVRADVFAAAIVEELAALAASGAPPAEPPDEVTMDLIGAPEGGGRAVAAALYAQMTAEVANA